MPEIAYATLGQAERDDEAKRLMAASGLEDLTLRLIYNTSESHKQIATVISQMWKQKLGVTTELANFEWKTYLNIMDNQEFDLARSGWCGDYNEASTFLDLLTTTHGANRGRYSNPEVDELMAASKTVADPGAIYAEVEQILAEDMAHHSDLSLCQHVPASPATSGAGLMTTSKTHWYSKNLYRVTD